MLQVLNASSLLAYIISCFGGFVVVICLFVFGGTDDGDCFILHSGVSGR